MKQMILQNWNFFRLLRLILGVVVVQAVMMKDIFFGLAGLLFSAMAIFNIGCCGMGGCQVRSTMGEKKSNDISYEEVSGNK